MAPHAANLPRGTVYHEVLRLTPENNRKEKDNDNGK